MMQQHDPISHPGHLIEMLAGHQDRDSVFTGAHPQQLADPYHPKRVEAVAGFIQNQHIRPMNQGHRDPETLPIAQRQRASRSMLPMVQLQIGDDRGRGDARRPPIPPLQAGRGVDRFRHSQLAIPRRSLNQVPHSAPHSPVGVDHRAAQHLRRSAVRSQHAQQQPHQSRLACPVETDQRDNLPGTDFQVDAGNSLLVAEAPGDGVRSDQ